MKWLYGAASLVVILALGPLAAKTVSATMAFIVEYPVMWTFVGLAMVGIAIPIFLREQPPHIT
jgi:hypothetical protein